jgi:hypothetical protein
MTNLDAAAAGYPTLGDIVRPDRPTWAADDYFQTASDLFKSGGYH